MRAIKGRLCSRTPVVLRYIDLLVSSGHVEIAQLTIFPKEKSMEYKDKKQHRKKWQQPKLTILIRSESNLEILQSCKRGDYGSGIGGPGQFFSGCYNVITSTTNTGWCNELDYHPPWDPSFLCCVHCSGSNNS